jgi:hypothetical protein
MEYRLGIIGVAVILYLIGSLRVLRQYERGVVLRPFAASPINLRVGRVYQVAMRIEGGENSCLIGPQAWLKFVSVRLHSRNMTPPSRRRAPKTARHAALHHRSDFGWGI